MKRALKAHPLPREAAQGARVQSWSTDPVPPQHRSSYWELALEAAYGGTLRVQGEAVPSGMSASICKLSLPELQLGHLRGLAQRFRCSEESPYPLLVIVDAEHEWTVLAGAERETVPAGHIAVLRAASGALLDFRFGVAATVLAGSKPWSLRWLGDTQQEAPLRIAPGDRGWGRILSVTLRELAANPQLAANEAGGAVADTIGSALAAALRTEPAPRFTSDLYSEARRLCTERLSDPELNVRAVAQMLGVSVRTLGRAYEDAGTTFAESLREIRLAQAAALLASPALAHLGVAEVGRQCGFVSASHFVREFRRHWGTTPGQARAGIALAQTCSDALGRADQLLAETRTRIEAQKARISWLGATQSPLMPMALELLRTLEDSLDALERRRAASESTA